MKHDIHDAQFVDDVTQTVYNAKKTVTAVGSTVALIGTEVLASGLLHGTAQTVVQCVLAALGVFGIGGGVYKVENKPKKSVHGPAPTSANMHADGNGKA